MGAASEGFLDLVNSVKMREFWKLTFFENCAFTVRVDGQGNQVQHPSPDGDDELLTEKLNGPYLTWDPAVESLEEAMHRPFRTLEHKDGTASVISNPLSFIVRVIVTGPASFGKEEYVSFQRSRVVHDICTQTYRRSDLTHPYRIVAAVYSIQGRIGISTFGLSGAFALQPRWLFDHASDSGRLDLQQGDFCFFAYALCSMHPELREKVAVNRGNQQPDNRAELDALDAEAARSGLGDMAKTDRAGVEIVAANLGLTLPPLDPTHAAQDSGTQVPLEDELSDQGDSEEAAASDAESSSWANSPHPAEPPTSEQIWAVIRKGKSETAK
ncbi:hypothetical protein N3K66_008747 [Trichothecium roseum]|uniref:Uncharacterized protein n=1 Tax=Trichothecium roseum TaxID=47278 RepID=A0ACC0UR88_9HYPO|nr:hypothetical protein N3K66_008747 [Trichothecium roseum]